MTRAQAMMKARRTWNAAAYASRAMPEVEAATHLFDAAGAVRRLLEAHVPAIEDMDEPEEL